MSKQKILIEKLVNIIINNEDNISLDNLVSKYTKYDPKIINEIVKKISDLDYKIISTNPIKVKKR